MPQPSTVKILRNITEIRREETGMIFPAAITFDDWLSEVSALQTEHKAYMWHLGDAFIVGEERWSELYAQGVEAYSADTIRRAVKICRIFPMRRRRTCGFSYHQAVEKLAEREQDELLDMAVSKRWGREALREEVRERSGKPSQPMKINLKPTGAADPAPSRPIIEPTEEEIETVTRLAHEIEPTPLTEWHANLKVIPGGLSEPVAGPETVDEAIDLLQTLSKNLPGPIADAVALLIEDRAKVVDYAQRLVASVKRSVDMGFSVSPNCSRLANELPYPPPG